MWERDTTCPLLSFQSEEVEFCFDLVCILELPDQHEFNRCICKCSRAFYLKFFQLKGIVQTLHTELNVDC